MKILCRIGIHNKTVREDVPEELKEFYRSSKFFTTCDCGKLRLVEYMGGVTDAREIEEIENTWIQINKKSPEPKKTIRKTRKKKNAESA